MKKIIRLTENDLHKIIMGALNEVFNMAPVMGDDEIYQAIKGGLTDISAWYEGSPKKGNISFEASYGNNEPVCIEGTINCIDKTFKINRIFPIYCRGMIDSNHLDSKFLKWFKNNAFPELYKKSYFNAEDKLTYSEREKRFERFGY